jgi:nitrite reductase (NO-forming)
MRKLFASLLIAATVAGVTTAAVAEETHSHEHGAASGTPEAPLDIVRGPADLPGSSTAKGPRTVKVGLETVEVTGRLADGASYHYWTFNRQVPGPFIRVRVNDTVEVTLANKADSAERHSIDLHAVLGPAGGAIATDAAPGETKSFRFKAARPGLYVYHCATPSAARHIANGMYGLILVEPEGGLPKVDREFYVMQGEVYTALPLGAKGFLAESKDKLLGERPEYVVFNGSATALREKPLKARVGETVRIFFGNGGPNLSSSFHVIGGIFDKAYPLGSLGGEPLPAVQTVGVPAGGSTVVEMKLEVPGRYVLVDHALSRVERGAAGFLEVEGPADDTLFHVN